MSTPDDNKTLTGAGRLIADRYRLESELGGGAMGTVWSAVDELLRRPVAVKEVRLPPGMPEEEAAELRERALREARAIAVVTHPNVVTLYDVAREAGEPFVVMELVPSQSLAAILAEHGALDDEQLAVITDGVAAALEAAHRAGIVHRDVKPGNVLIGDDGRIKLSDFGISRNISEHTITRTGIMLGTPAFIAPEIASGEAVTDSADLWGLGATLFAAAEGRTPYDAGDDPVATVTEVVRGPVPVTTRTGPVGEVIAGLMVKDPAERMTLTEARRRIRHLMPEPGVRPFSMLLDPEAPTVKVRRPVKSTPPRGGTQRAEPQPAPLASEPGLLPFMVNAAPPPAKRSPWPAIALGVVAVVLFAAALTGGFFTARTVADRWSPPTAQPPAGRSEPWTPLRYETRHSRDSGTGLFQIAVPGGWNVFQGERDELSNSKAVSFVSPDGREEVVVERFGGFVKHGYGVEQYLEALPEMAAGSEGEFTMDSDTPFPNPDSENHRLNYTTTETALAGGPGRISRHTASSVLPGTTDLWIVRVTVPSENPGRANELSDLVLPTFKQLG
ncbi:serine/threonine-protein kinase [Saccharopolyspora taberi]|uniref:non-specific serine/threonine protein kinase n=1 Tax=Saccharopolyspora taberi TaxID=60895 RepID=A0ABN3V703_9PSEU